MKKESAKRNQQLITKQVRAMAVANKIRWEEWRRNFRIEARREFPRLFTNPLFITGINLYWGEGDSKLKNGRVAVVNTDPTMIALFVKFLRRVAKIPDEKIFAWLTLYPDLPETKCKLF